MAKYKCSHCGMGVTDMKCAKCGKDLVHNHITKDELITIQLIVISLFSLFIVYLFRLCTSF